MKNKTSDMKKMAYFCPVDWRWIKQRPQFLAEELNRFYQVHVIYPFSKNRKGLQRKTPTDVVLTPYITLPAFRGRFALINRINQMLVWLQAGVKILMLKPDVIWLTLPEQLDMIPRAYRGRIVYDCMDDYAAMSADAAARERILFREKKLVDASGLVFATSENLSGKISARCGAKNVHLLRNGYNAQWTQSAEGGAREEARFKIGYFGTISHWFDFELLTNSLLKSSSVEYHLFGPVAGGVKIPEDPRIVYHGVVAHEEIRGCAAQMDALMMPFLLNDIVLSVDPVKLYEYICLNKDILCVRYPEVQRFEPFVYFYSDQDEFDKRIAEMASGKPLRYTKEQAGDFLKENSWMMRAKTASQMINNTFGG